MKNGIIVSLGGAIGAFSRYKIGGILLHHTSDWKFPISTFAVNVAGCLAAGLLAGLIEKHGFFSAETRLFLLTGLLGGFTTFSAFGVETFYLIQRHEILWAAVYAAGSVFLGVAALFWGVWMIR